MKKKNYKRLSLRERIIIETLLIEEQNKTYIASQLERSRSSITREVNRWVRKPTDKYEAYLAHWYSVTDNDTKRLDSKIDSCKRLKLYVFRGLLNKLSPDLISGRIAIDYPNDKAMRISHEAIYQYIYTHPQGKLNKKLIRLLHRHKSRRKKRGSQSYRRGLIKDAISIEQRPLEVEKRLNIGDFESDLIIGKGQQSAIGTMVDRKSRFVYIVKLSNRKSKTVVNSFVKAMRYWPRECSSTMTYDNGKEMSEHKLFTKQTGMKVYFAHPYSSWERGTNENTNGIIRRFFPKGTDFNKVSESQLLTVQNWLNNRPRKILKYKSPLEVLEQHHNIFSVFNQLHKKKLVENRKNTTFESNNNY